MEVDMADWMGTLTERLKKAFGSRLVLVGLQGSRARGEERETSDIDVVVVIDGLSVNDLSMYRSIIQQMPNSDLACGFVGSPAVLAEWPRHDVFNLVNDTDVKYGSFDFMDTVFTQEDAQLAAKACASEIYHVLCHTTVFEPDSLSIALKGCLKSAFFGIRAHHYAQTGRFVNSRAHLRDAVRDDERLLLDAYDEGAHTNDSELEEKLLHWAELLMKS